MTELPIDERFAHARGLLDDLLRSNADVFAPYELDEEDEPIAPVSNPILGDWVVVAHWMNPEGHHHYVRVCSSDLAPHSRLGLLAMFEGDD